MAVFGCLAASTGCYGYQAVSPGAVSPGARVRAQISSEAVLRLEPVFGGLSRSVQGEVIEADAAQLLLLARLGAAPMTAGVPGGFISAQRIVLERREIVQIEERYLSRGRSAALTLGVASGLIGAAVYFFTGRSRGRDNTGPVDGPELF